MCHAARGCKFRASGRLTRKPAGDLACREITANVQARRGQGSGQTRGGLVHV